MSGHNKWSTIKHKKGAADAKRGKVFTKLIKEITIAARSGGGDPNGNPRLRTAIAAAKASSMPKDNIERAVKKGTGELEGESIDEIVYEGYGPGGVAIILELATDNKNRTSAEVRHMFSKNGGNMGENGCVSWMFDRKGALVFKNEERAEKVDEDRLMEIGLEAEGFQDIETDEDQLTVYTDPTALYSVREIYVSAGLEPDEAKLVMIPQNTVKVEGKKAEQVLRMYEVMDDYDDTVAVWSNYEIDDEEFDRIMNS